MNKRILNDGIKIKIEGKFCDVYIFEIEKSKLRKLLLEEKQQLTKAEHKERRLKAYKPKK